MCLILFFLYPNLHYAAELGDLAFCWIMEKPIWDIEPIPQSPQRRQSTYRRLRFNGCSLCDLRARKAGSRGSELDPLCYSFNHFSCPMPVALESSVKITDDSDPNLRFLIMVIRPFTSKSIKSESFSNTDGPTDYYIKWSKSDRGRQIYHLHVESKKINDTNDLHTKLK